MTIQLRFATTTQVFSAPKGYTEERAVAWLADLHTSGAARRIKRQGDTYFCSNGRRGSNLRQCTIEVVGRT